MQAQYLYSHGAFITRFPGRPSRAQGVAVVPEGATQVLEVLVRQGKAMYFRPAPEPPKSKDKNRYVVPDLDPNSGELPALEAYFSQPPILLPTEEERQARLTNNKLQTAEPLARLETRLLNTYYTARTSLEKTGVNILYLALGQLTWFETESSTKARQAPLVLVPVPRDRSPLPAASRKLTLIAPQELAQAVLRVVRQSLAIEREAVAGPAAKLFGFSRLVGEEPRQLFEAVTQQLIVSRQLTETNGVLRPVE